MKINAVLLAVKHTLLQFKASEYALSRLDVSARGV